MLYAAVSGVVVEALGVCLAIVGAAFGLVLLVRGRGAPPAAKPRPAGWRDDFLLDGERLLDFKTADDLADQRRARPLRQATAYREDLFG